MQYTQWVVQCFRFDSTEVFYNAEESLCSANQQHLKAFISISGIVNLALCPWKRHGYFKESHCIHIPMDSCPYSPTLLERIKSSITAFFMFCKVYVTNFVCVYVCLYLLGEVFRNLKFQSDINRVQEANKVVHIFSKV